MIPRSNISIQAIDIGLPVEFVNFRINFIKIKHCRLNFNFSV